MKRWIIILGLILICAGNALAATADQRLPTHLSVEGSLWAGSEPAALSPTTDGAKIYKQWCSTCHGDRGQGLTAEWRAEWPEGKQNCWQSKCHAANHPPDGFSFPKEVPALIGPNTLTKFRTAQDLYVYSQAAMPYWSPNLLSDAEYRAITIFLVEANYQERGLSFPGSLPPDLSAVALQPPPMGQAPTKSLDSATPPASGSQPPTPARPTMAGLSPLWISLIVLAGSLIVFLVRRIFFSRSLR